MLVHGLTPNLGGLESFILNYYRHMNHDKIHFDFICNDPIIACEDELKSYGCKIIHLPMKSKKFIHYKNQINTFFKEHSQEYDCVWDNALTLSNLDYLKLAKKYGIKRRIIHAHNSKNMFTGIKGKVKALLHVKHRNEIVNYATDFFATSVESRDYFYLPNLYKRVKIIKDAIDIKEFRFNIRARERIRSKFNLNGYLVLGNVARLQYQKNQFFSLSILKKLVEKNNKIKFVFVGAGPDKAKLMKRAKELGVLENTLFVGMQKNIDEWLSCFDIFVFPSLFEGLGMALLEAEANGLPIIASQNVIPKEVKLNSNFEFASLKLGPNIWSKKITNMVNWKRLDFSVIKRNFEINGWDIKTAAKELEEVLIKEDKK